MINRITPSVGKLLISEPFLNDPNFTRSVVLLTEHGENGTLGFVINHPSLLMLDDLIPDIGGGNFTVFLGGPVATDTIHFIHRCPDKISDGEEIAKGIYWGGNFETLKVLLAQGEISPDEVRFFIGYSGWGEQQLK
ncbi:MAG TPA: YqgE/AlgH family protein, partial [Pedobacter sp.]